MFFEMSRVYILFFFFASLYGDIQGPGSGTNGNLRLCIVEGRGTYKRAGRFCPVLDAQNSGVECVIGTDRLDCLRRMGKGTVDFGVFYPEDLIAAQWADVDILVTNELRNRPRQYERSIVAVVNRSLLLEGTSVHSILRNRSLCHPGHDEDDRQPLSDALSDYLIELVTEKYCNANMSIIENRLKGMQQFFGEACVPGPWVSDIVRDAELKKTYGSLCSACRGGSRACEIEGRYWGAAGALLCLAEGAGDFTWAKLDDVSAYFGLIPGTKGSSDPDNFVYLCRDGTSQPLKNNYDPCVWINRPWRVIASKRKAAEAVGKVATSLTNRSITISENWQGALAALLEINEAQPDPLQPPYSPLDYLARANGFREAYSQSGCEPPRHITVCTTSAAAQSKCEWLSEAGAVYGAGPPLQCARRDSPHDCLLAARSADVHALVADSDWLLPALRDYNFIPVLHETTPIIDQASTVVAYVRSDAMITNMADLRGKRAAFPRYDGHGWHSVSRYIRNKEKLSCHGYLRDYFSGICAPGIEKYNVSKDIVDSYTSSCNKKEILEGEEEALRSLVEGTSDVAFISLSTYNMYKANMIQSPWAMNPVKLTPICPEENETFCFISWANIGHIFAPQNLTTMRHQEIVNLFKQLDQLFGKYYPFHSAMFSMYGPFNHQTDVLFHNNTKHLETDVIFKMHPYNKIPLNFESDLSNAVHDSCHLTDFNFGTKLSSTIMILFVCLVVIIISK